MKNQTAETKDLIEKKLLNLPIDVKGFVEKNVTPYYGDDSFLEGPTTRTNELWQVCLDAMLKEREKGGCLAIDTETISSITSHKPGYINKELELIVGLQTDELLKRAMKPFGGIRVVEGAVAERGLKVAEEVLNVFKHTSDHNNGVFSAYDDEIKQYRSLGILTGLPDNYARGRIIGDYRRLALYGADELIKAKKRDLKAVTGVLSEHKIRLREEITSQIKALKDMVILGNSYGLQLNRPAASAREAIQWLYMAYLAAVKEQDGAAMSLGNVSNFMDIYIEKDLAAGVITETEAQELVDQFVMKLRMVRHLRPGAYDDIFGGDPTWVTEAIGGQFNDGRTKVTKTSFRFLQTLYNLGASPEPNLTVLWSQDLPEGFKKFCGKVSIDTSSIQYENDDLMRETRGSDDYGIACCVSYQELGKRIQFFGARTNLPKTLLMALNEGREEISGTKVLKDILPLEGEYLDYELVMENFKKSMSQIAEVYSRAMNIIHYMHDRHYYEKAQLALIDSDPGIDMAYGAAGISIIADSLSAIKYAKVKPVRNEDGLTVDFIVEGDYPKFGNDEDSVDEIAAYITKYFSEELAKHACYKNARPTLSLLTITSNVMYGKKTGATPDGRKAGEVFAPGANPMHGRDTNGAVAALSSVAKLDYKDALDGISNTFSIIPKSLGSAREEQIENLTRLLDGYFELGAHHLNVNVLDRETLMDAYENPEKYPQLTIRVSGYAVNFTRLSKAHQMEVITRTFHDSL
ncbi:formate C-acetyltransferase [Salegentibacter holothuriorum]|uniref:Formate acetyltransferase n=1 Tax=Salegentibacter holothuriorum TaxID=241145 RepID=A0A1T5D0G1_9FLAO|nr:formate C-acetyltransferase [Salegentibacter holothuriorum]SKB65194.1 formate C-acetyltransferase [Salegentibacter holothuriorum]